MAVGNLTKQIHVWPTTTVLQNTASLSNFSIKFAKTRDIQFRVYSVSDWSHVVRKPIRMSEDLGGQMNEFPLPKVAVYFKIL